MLADFVISYSWQSSPVHLHTFMLKIKQHLSSAPLLCGLYVTEWVHACPNQSEFLISVFFSAHFTLSPTDPHLYRLCGHWHCGIVENMNSSFTIRKWDESVCRIIFSGQYTDSSLSILRLDRLRNRRTTVCSDYAVCTCESGRFNEWFPKSKENV